MAYYESCDSKTNRNAPAPMAIKANPKRGWFPMNDNIVVTNDNKIIANPPKMRYHANCLFCMFEVPFKTDQ